MSSGAATVLLFLPIVIWAVVIELWLVSICYRKKKPRLARLGLIGLVVPGFFVFALVGASRLATPSSNWAVMHYGDDFMGRSARRFPNDDDIAIGFSLPKTQRALWEKLIVAGLAATAVFLILLVGKTDYTGVASMLMLAELGALTWLAEVELTAKPYSPMTVSATSPVPQPEPATQ